MLEHLEHAVEKISDAGFKLYSAVTDGAGITPVWKTGVVSYVNDNTRRLTAIYPVDSVLRGYVGIMRDYDDDAHGVRFTQWLMGNEGSRSNQDGVFRDLLYHAAGEGQWVMTSFGAIGMFGKTSDMSEFRGLVRAVKMGELELAMPTEKFISEIKQAVSTHVR